MTEFDEELQATVVEMTEALRLSDVPGISAVQIGKPVRVVVISCIGDRILTFINPRIVKGSGRLVSSEACPSLPGRWITVQRHRTVTVEHLRQSGLELLEVTDVEVAVAFQHEIDHLNGVLTLDRRNWSGDVESADV